MGFATNYDAARLLVVDDASSTWVGLLRGYLVRNFPRTGRDAVAIRKSPLIAFVPRTASPRRGMPHAWVVIYYEPVSAHGSAQAAKPQVLRYVAASLQATMRSHGITTARVVAGRVRQLPMVLQTWHVGRIGVEPPGEARTEWLFAPGREYVVISYSDEAHAPAYTPLFRQIESGFKSIT